MSAAQHTPVRVLVADDEAAVRDSYRDILKPRNTPATGGLDEMRARLFGTRQPAADTQRFDLTLCGGAEEAVQAVHDANEDGQPFRRDHPARPARRQPLLSAEALPCP